MIVVASIDAAREQMKVLGFSDEDRGALVALLLTLDKDDRFVVFNDSDDVVRASLRTLLARSRVPAPVAAPVPAPAQVLTPAPAPSPTLAQLQQQAQLQRPQQQQQQMQMQPQQQRIFQQQQLPAYPTGFGYGGYGAPDAFGFDAPVPTALAPQPTKRSRSPTAQMYDPRVQPYFGPVVSHYHHHLHSMTPRNFDDDEAPVDSPPAYEAVNPGSQQDQAQQAATVLAMSAKTMIQAIQSNKKTELLSLVNLKAPALPEAESTKATVAVDLVAVLDISGSMSGAKIELLKDAVRFVVRELTEKDRLSLVVFNSHATRLNPLTVMTQAGKDKVLRIVEGIHASGGTMISAGLTTSLKVINERRHPNSVPSILLLSDGQDGAPAVVRGMEIPYVVHTFGFGQDHDAGLLGDVAEKTHGTFCFVEKFDEIQNAFASCVGGLVSLFAQKIEVTVTMAEPYQFSQWHSRFPTTVSPDRKTATVTINDIYAGEFRDLVFELSVPALPAPTEASPAFTATCHYTAAGAVQHRVDLPGVAITLCRPADPPVGVTADFELDKQWNRILTAKAMTEATTLCQDNKYQAAQKLIQDTIAKIQASVSANDPLCVAQVQDLKTSASRLVDRTSYETSGKAYVMQQAQQNWHQRTSYQPASAAAQAYTSPAAQAWTSKSQAPPKGFH